MAENLDPKQLVTAEGIAITSMGAIAEVLEVLEWTGLLPKGKPKDRAHERRTG